MIGTRLGAILPLAAFLLAACAGPPRPLYAPYGQFGSYGFSEEQLSETRLRIRYAAPARTSFDVGRIGRERDAEARLTLAYDMALLRAAELALAQGYPAFTVTERHNDVEIEVEADYPYPYWRSPFLFDAPFHRRHFPHYYPGPFFYDRYATVGAGVTLLIELQRTPGPDAHDAQATSARLRAKHPGAVLPVG